MTIPSSASNADVRAWSFDELVGEAIASIPAHAQHWTDHNPSDPGITLIELLAYFTEILLFRALRVTPDARLNFLRLMRGTDWGDWKSLQGGGLDSLTKAFQDCIADASKVCALVTPLDAQRLVATEAQAHLDPDRRGVRAVCLQDVTPAHSIAADHREGDLCVVLSPVEPMSDSEFDALARAVRDKLDDRRMLTSGLHLLRSVTVEVRVGCRLVLPPESQPYHRTALLDLIDEALRLRFEPPLAQGVEQAPPLGRSVHLAEIAEVIDRTRNADDDGPLVDFVEQLAVHRLALHRGARGRQTVDTPARVGVRLGTSSTIGVDARFGTLTGPSDERLQRGPDGDVTSVLLRPWELASVKLDRDHVDITGILARDTPEHRHGR